MSFWAKLFGRAKKKPKMADAIVTVARGEVGVREIGRTNKGPRVDEYRATTSLSIDYGWPWCAAFVCWVIREAAKLSGLKESDTYKHPTTAAAFAFPGWSLRQDSTTQTKRRPITSVVAGDIVVFTFSHIGIATGHADASGDFPTIEGNTDFAGSREGGGVYEKRRNLSQVKARIRFTV